MGWVLPAAAILAASAAQAQMPAPYEIERPAIVVSDMSGPYAAMPPDAVPMRDGPRLLPAPEVYTVVRDSGFSPLGAPRQRGFVYTIAVINDQGDDGRLVIDARTGRIVRFMPAYLESDRFNGDMTETYGPVGLLPPTADIRRGPPRPPALVPRRFASRSPSAIPLPRPSPHAVVAPKVLAPKHLAEKPKPAAPPMQQSASVQAKPAETKPAVAAPAPVEAKPTVTIEPTKDMPAVQGLN
jgi:hypothetical protein